MNGPTIVAEIGCNHQGDLEIAKEMVQTAATFCKVDYVKFQKRCVKELLTSEEYDAPHPAPLHSYGRTYGEHREYLEFTIDEHRELLEWCKRHDVGYSTSVWDPTSAREAVELSPHHIKIPSACNLDFRILQYLATGFAGEIHISLGMTTPEEEHAIVRFIEREGAADRVVLYACTSGYPVPFEQLCLREIARLRNEYGDRVKAIGFSGHHLGIAADVAAVTLGASWIERHFTLDRTWKGTDHAASLEPDGFRRLVRDVRAVSRALTAKDRSILEIEEAQRRKLKRLPGVHFSP
jgi:N-acetylneuraminate synthase